MAKGNMFLGHAKGKVGSVVFSRAFGQQVSRTKPSSVKNPKTHAQNAQRAILATVAKAASVMTPIVDHAFAGVAYGAESVRHFRKINLNQLRALYIDGDPTGYNLTPKGGAVVPNSYIVSQGNLPSFQMAYDNGVNEIGFKMTENNTGEDSVKVSTFLEAYPYLQGGDQLTLVKLVLTSGSLQNGDAKFAFLYDRIVFAPNAFDEPNSLIISQDGYFVRSKLDLTKTTNPDMLVIDTIANHTMLCVTGNNLYAAALILSREVNGQWQRSTQEMGLTHEQDVQNIESAIASYAATASESEDSEYLNQADESGSEQEGVSGAYMNVTTQRAGSDANTDKVNAGESDSASIEGASGTIVSIGAQAYAPTGTRIITVEIDRPDGSYAAHGAKSVYYNIGITAQTAGTWKVTTLYSDGTRAEYAISLSVKA